MGSLSNIVMGVLSNNMAKTTVQMIYKNWKPSPTTSMQSQSNVTDN